MAEYRYNETCRYISVTCKSSRNYRLHLSIPKGVIGVKYVPCFYERGRNRKHGGAYEAARQRGWANGTSGRRGGRVSRCILSAVRGCACAETVTPVPRCCGRSGARRTAFRAGAALRRRRAPLPLNIASAKWTNATRRNVADTPLRRCQWNC